MSVAVVVGTRPEIIKMSPVLRALEAEGIPVTLIHTGQHYDPRLTSTFLAELGMPRPRHDLGVGSGEPAAQLARIFEGADRVFREDRPALVLVHGDTNTVAAALAAARLGVPVGHVEAGLRSFDAAMPEEQNRRFADLLATWRYAPTERARSNLLAEGVDPATVVLTGNTIADVVGELIARGALEAGRAGGPLARFGVEPGQYVLTTAHRGENVDDAAALGALLATVGRVARSLGLPALLPCHPRTQARIAAFGLPTPPGLALIEPLGLSDFLTLERHAALVLTDSGGVQEEACILQVPCVTLRASTERPETVELGANVLAGLDPDRAEAAARAQVARRRGWDHPFGDGRAGERIARHVASVLGTRGSAWTC